MHQAYSSDENNECHRHQGEQACKQVACTSFPNAVPECPVEQEEKRNTDQQDHQVKHGPGFNNLHAFRLTVNIRIYSIYFVVCNTATKKGPATAGPRHKQEKLTNLLDS